MGHEGYTTSVTRFMRAPREAVYRALIDPSAVAQWLHPEGMRCQVHAFDAREGGELRMSMIYEDEAHSNDGKTAGNADTFGGRFVRLVPNTQVVEAIEFETENADIKGEMRITITLADAPGGTEVTWLHENVPAAIRAEDNEMGTRMTLDNLAALVEGR